MTWKEERVRLISEKEVLRRLREDIEARKDHDDIISKSVVAGLEIAISDVLLSATEGRKE